MNKQGVVLAVLLLLDVTAAQSNSCEVTLGNPVFCRCDSLEIMDASTARCFILRPVTSSDNFWNAFQGQPNLSELRLDSQNDARIDFIPSRVFRWTRKLSVLEITNAEIREIPAKIFANLTELRELSLTRVKLARLAKKSFHNANHLTFLALDKNELEHLEKGVFSGLKNLENLLLGSNMISSIQEGVFKDLIHLRELDLSVNRIEILTSGTFSGLSSLQILSLESNSIELIEDHVFKHSLLLKHLNLRHNRLNVIKESLFSGLEHLEYLNLRDNAIFHVETKAWKQLPNLSYLDLKNNKLVAFDELIFHYLKENLLNSSMGLGLEGNPLECDCDFKWLQQLKAETQSFQVREMITYLSCQTESVQIKFSDYIFNECPDPTTTTTTTQSTTQSTTRSTTQSTTKPTTKPPTKPTTTSTVGLPLTVGANLTSGEAKKVADSSRTQNDQSIDSTNLQVAGFGTNSRKTKTESTDKRLMDTSASSGLCVGFKVISFVILFHRCVAIFAV